MVTRRDIKNYIRVLLYSYYTTITGWGVLLKDLYKPEYLVPWEQIELFNAIEVFLVSAAGAGQKP